MDRSVEISTDRKMSRRLVTFILWAFLPMIALGYLHSVLRFSSDLTTTNLSSAVLFLLFSAGAMLIPLMAVVFAQIVIKEPVLRDLGVSFRFNRWWLIGWLLMPVLAVAVLGMSLLMPGAHWSTDGTVQASLQQMPTDIGPMGLIALGLFGDYICNHFGFDHHLLSVFWIKNQEEGSPDIYPVLQQR